ncbi:MAG: type II secretion system F family protein [Acidimicrobiales bacterium]
MADLLAPPGWLGARLADMGVAVDPAIAWGVWVAGAAGVTAWAVVAAGAGAGLLAIGMMVGSPCLGWRLFRHRGDSAIEAALPAAVEAVAAGLRSGASLRQALGETAAGGAGALGADLGVVAEATERGAGVVAALEGWAQRRPLPGVRLVVAALCLSAETGGAAAQAVDAVAATLRQRLAAEAEARALATQARTSAAVMAAAPVAFCTLSAALDPRSSAFLLRTPLGLALLGAGLGLDAVGAVWMARLTRASA